MRMDQRQTLSAKEVVNEYSEMELYHIIRDYGEEKFAKNIAKHIVSARNQKDIGNDWGVNSCYKSGNTCKSAEQLGGHPAKRTFQAIRIEVNQGTGRVGEFSGDMIDLLNDGGRICVITFHSLEDRIVKNKFRECENPCTCPKEFPVCVCGKKSKGKVITRKPVTTFTGRTGREQQGKEFETSCIRT